MLQFLLTTLVLPRGMMAITWTTQTLASPYGGLNRGVRTGDINNDGATDLLFAGGKDTDHPGQPFALINLGKKKDSDTFQFSDPVPIGSPGAYQQVDSVILGTGKVNVLLSGGPCTTATLGTCRNNPAVLLDVTVNGCGFWPPNLQTGTCVSKSNVIWTDPNPLGDQQAAFSVDLGKAIRPAIVLAGKGGVSVYEAQAGSYTTAAFSVKATDNPLFADLTGLAIGYIGNHPGFVVSSESSGKIIAVYKDLSTESYQYSEITSGVTHASGISLGDINGDGVNDFIVSKYDKTSQSFYLLDSNMVNTATGSIFQPANPVVSARLGSIYNESDLPDAVYAMDNGELITFANQGSGSNPQFVENDKLTIPGCKIQDFRVAEVWPCTVSIVAATTCSTGGSNYMFTATTCDIMEWLNSLSSPAASPTAPDNDDSPSAAPIILASGIPTNPPTTFTPTFVPTIAPTTLTPTFAPKTLTPTFAPKTLIPAFAPTTLTPTFAPTTSAPSTAKPSASPSTRAPFTTPPPTSSPTTATPSTVKPSASLSTRAPFTTPPPTSSPTTASPSTVKPSASPSTRAPFATPPPTISPTTATPTMSPITATHTMSLTTAIPSFRPTKAPTLGPTLKPTPRPTVAPTLYHSLGPTLAHSGHPTVTHSSVPTAAPSTSTPSFAPTRHPTNHPSFIPSDAPSLVPTLKPSFRPSSRPTTTAPITDRPTVYPTPSASTVPSWAPSFRPSDFPSLVPTVAPSSIPTVVPTASQKPSHKAALPLSGIHSQSNKRAADPLNIALIIMGAACVVVAFAVWRFSSIMKRYKTEEIERLTYETEISSDGDTSQRQEWFHRESTGTSRAGAWDMWSWSQVDADQNKSVHSAEMSLYVEEEETGSVANISLRPPAMRNMKATFGRRSKHLRREPPKDISLSSPVAEEEEAPDENDSDTTPLTQAQAPLAKAHSPQGSRTTNPFADYYSNPFADDGDNDNKEEEVEDDKQNDNDTPASGNDFRPPRLLPVSSRHLKYPLQKKKKKMTIDQFVN